MPPLGGPGPRRTNTRAYRKRERNIARIPKATPQRANVYVPPARAYKPTGPRPTPAQLSAARAQERAYASQGRAIQTEAKHQRVASYLSKAPAQRRAEVKQIKAKAPSERTSGERRVLDIHGQRQGVDVRQRKDYGFLPRVKGREYTPTYEVRPTNVMPRPAKPEPEREATVIYKGKRIPAVLLETDPAKLKAAGFHKPGTLEKVIDAPGKYGIKALSYPVADVAEIVETTPSSLAHLGVTAATHPKKLPGLLAEPYVDLYHHPINALKRPVSTALMFAPVAKVPGLAAGRVARVAGKQTLARPAATLPGTTLKVARTGSRGVVTRARQARKDVKQPAPTTTTKQLERRVDEFYDAAQQHKQAAQASAARQANQQHGHLPKGPARDEAIQTKLSGARGGAQQHVEREFAREFGSHWHPGPGGTIVKPKAAPEHGGRIHATREDAQRVADAIDRAGHFEPKVIELEGATPGETSGFAVIPKQAADRYAHHKRVGKSPATGAVVLRTGSRQFRKTVLPLSTKWLGGQVTEAALRAAAHGAGPTSYLRANRLLKTTERTATQDALDAGMSKTAAANVGAQAADALRQRTLAGGQFGVTGPAAEFAGKRRTLAEEFEPTGLAEHATALTRVGAAPGLRHVRHGFKRYSDFVFNTVNGSVEEFAKTAMLGKAVKQGPLMERHLLGLSDKAIDEAARGLRHTSTQVELGRQLDRAYGKYSKYGPHAREAIVHTTPFVPWFRNMVLFLGHVLPKDHPITTGLLADLSAADEEWRKQHQLSTRQDEHVPGFMIGSYPTKNGKYIPVGRFGPFLPGEPVGDIGGQIVPQYSGAILNLAGVDWTGKKLPGGQGRRLSNALLTEAEALIPGTSQADRVTGLADKYVRGKTNKPSVAQGNNKLSKAVIDLINPVKAVGHGDRSKKRKPPARPARRFRIGGDSGFRIGGSGQFRIGGGSGFGGGGFGASKGFR